MAESSWNTSVPDKPRRRGFPVWILVPLVLIVAGAVIGFALAGRATGLRRQAWPLVQAVHKRLATDEGARDLYRKNPACADGYESEEAFLESVRGWRAKIGSLPVSEPQDDIAGYNVNSDPFELTVACRGQGGGWLRARFVTGPAAAGRDVGEGLSQLVFADSFKQLLGSARQARRQERNRQWEEFRGLLLRLGEDGSASTLYRGEAALRERWTTEEAFLKEIRSWRQALAAIPEDMPDREKDPTQSVEFSRNHTPFGDSREIRLTHPGGTWKVAWRNGALASIDHKSKDGSAPARRD